MAVVAAAIVVSVLGGSVAVTLPADRKVAELEKQFTQNWQQQQQYHQKREQEELYWNMRYISDRINTLLKIPTVLKRPLTPEEQWELEQLRREWMRLKEKQEGMG